MIQLDERAIVYRSYKAAIKSIKSKGGDARRPIERYHQLKTRAKDNYQMKLSEQDVTLLSKIYQLAIQYADKKLHDDTLANQIRALRDRYNEASMQEGTLEDHPENCKDTSCVMCYPPVNALSNVLDRETREQRSKDMQEAIDRETSARIGRAGCRGNDCD
jgi:hypothetical protein